MTNAHVCRLNRYALFFLHKAQMMPLLFTKHKRELNKSIYILLCVKNGVNIEYGRDKCTERLCLPLDKCASLFFFYGQKMPLLFKTNRKESNNLIYA